MPTEATELICAGCNQPIALGQHYMKVRVELATRMGDGYEPVHEVTPTVLEAIVHDPFCQAQWQERNSIIHDVFVRR